MNETEMAIIRETITCPIRGAAHDQEDPQPSHKIRERFMATSYYDIECEGYIYIGHTIGVSVVGRGDHAPISALGEYYSQITVISGNYLNLGLTSGCPFWAKGGPIR